MRFFVLLLGMASCAEDITSYAKVSRRWHSIWFLPVAAMVFHTSVDWAPACMPGTYHKNNPFMWATQTSLKMLLNDQHTMKSLYGLNQAGMLAKPETSARRAA